MITKYNQIFTKYKNIAEEEIGKFKTDDILVGCMYNETPRYLVNEDECDEYALDLIEADWNDIKMENNIHHLMGFHCFKLEINHN